MTIQINTAQLVPAEAHRLTEALVGIDLTLFGASRPAGSKALGIDLPVEHMSYPQLASAVSAAAAGGLDFVSLSDGFVTRTDHEGDRGRFDAALTVGRLIEHCDLGLSARVPESAKDFERAIGLMNRAGNGWACIELPVRRDSDFEQMGMCARKAHAVGATVAVRIALEDFEAIDWKPVATFADAVRLLGSNPHKSREARFALRSAAADCGRELKVLCELGFIVSATREAARERKVLLGMLGHADAFAGKAVVAGTVADVVDEAERWISAGATDGIIFMPASVPTDFASLIRGILPLLRARHA